MNWAPAEQVLSAVGSQRQVIAQQKARIAYEEQYHAAERHKIEAELQLAIHDFGQALLVQLDSPSIAKAANTVGLLGLPNEHIPAKLEARRAWVEARLTQIAHDPRYANRELLRHPHTGTLTMAIAEALDFQKPGLTVIATCNGHPRFNRLMDILFDTPEYTGSWWRYSYWKDRSAADQILALFPGKTKFAEVREEFRVASATALAFGAELARLQHEVEAGQALDREYAVLYDEDQHIDARWLEEVRTRLVRHTMTSDTSLMSKMLEATPALRLLFLRASGLQAKLSYLDGIQRTNIREMWKDLATQIERLDGVEQRTRRRWTPMPLDKFQKIAEDKRPRYEKRWQKFGKVYTQVRTFDRWDRGRRFDDLLWWDVMTRGRYDGSYLPEVNQFHQAHPNYLFDPNDLKGSNADFFGSGDDLSAADDQDAAAAGVDADLTTDSDTDSPDVIGADAS